MGRDLGLISADIAALGDQIDRLPTKRFLIGRMSLLLLATVILIIAFA